MTTEASTTAATAAAVTPAPVVAPVVATAVVAPQLTEDQKKLVDNQEAFKTRLAEAGDAATRKLYKDLGVKDGEEAKARLAELQKLKDAQLSDQERVAKQIAELTPKAARADGLEATVRKYLEIEEGLVPASKKELLELAPPASSPEARLEWIAQAKAKGLFTEAVIAALAPVATPAPANTRAGLTPPPTPAPANSTKHPRDMTPDEFRQYEAQKLTERTAR